MLSDKKERVNLQVKTFYNQNPFPGFDINKYMLKDDLYTNANIYARMLDDQIPWEKTILDAGCGTGQLACLLSLKNRRTLGIDFSEQSIFKAKELKKKLGLTNVCFRQEDLMELKMGKEPFDYIFCNGVLHHTSDPTLGFQNLLTYSKKGTVFIIGLYNRYGRLWHRIKCRRLKQKNTKNNHEVIQKMLVKDEEDREKLETWYQDQYLHPFEHTHTIKELLDWYKKNSIEYVNSLPPIELFRKEENSTRIFKNPTIKNWRQSKIAFFLKQLTWIISLRKTGGYFMIVGRKK